MAPYVKALSKAPGEALRVGVEFADLIRANGLNPAAVLRLEVETSGDDPDDGLEAIEPALNGTEATALLVGGTLGDTEYVTFRLAFPAADAPDDEVFVARRVRVAVQAK